MPYPFLTGVAPAITLNGQQDNVSVSHGIVNLVAGGQLSVSGSEDTITTANGATVYLAGRDNLLKDAGGSIVLSANSSASITGDHNVVNAQGNDNVTVAGNDEQVYLGSAANIGISGLRETVIGSNGTVILSDGSSATISGAHDDIVLGTGSTVGINGSDEIVSGSGITVNLLGSSTEITVIGENDVFTGSTYGNVINLVGASGTFNVSGATIILGDNADVHIVGWNNTIAGGLNDTVRVTGDFENIELGDGSDLYLTGHNELVSVSEGMVQLGNDSTVRVIGDDDHIYGASGDYLEVIGHGDTENVNNIALSSAPVFPTPIDFPSLDISSDMWEQLDMLYDWSNEDLDDQHDLNYLFYEQDWAYFFGNPGDWFWFGFAGKPQQAAATSMAALGAVARSQLATGDMMSTLNAISGLSQVYHAASGGAQDSGAAAVVTTGSHWEGPVLRWTLAPDALRDGQQAFSGSMEEYGAAVERAFAAWATLLPTVRFEQVSDPAQADVAIGFSRFATAQTGIVAYTGYPGNGGKDGPGIVIRIEDPTETAMVQDGGSQVYAGTQATLEQVLTHEIGHVLGFGDNADPNSIMSYYLGSQNRQFDETDVLGIASLYGVDTPHAELVGLAPLPGSHV
jgi:predicted Zn-dependent protease